MNRITFVALAMLAASGAAWSALAPGEPLPAGITAADCPEANSICGYLPVPLDRKHPDGAKLNIYFELYFHSNAGPAESTIMANLGGPGFGTTANRDSFQYLFGANMDKHDLLLVDDRGRGQSAPIDCAELQHGGALFAVAEQDCSNQLGLAASRYASGDIAEDMNDVRAALGIALIDYYGASWGGVDAIAYATRHPDHLRSLVLDSPVGPPSIIPSVRRMSYQTHATPVVLANLCNRSPLCAPDHPNAAADLSGLIQALRLRPAEGDSHDASGNPVHIRVDERALLDYVLSDSIFHGNFSTRTETLAAAVALQQGDSAPLLRLAAEGLFSLDPYDHGDAGYLSMGAFYATSCMDAGEPWNWSSSPAERAEAYAEFIGTLPNDYFAPFSRSVGNDILFSDRGKQCLWWKKPTPSAPIVRPGDVYPNVPVLVLGGDVDARVPLAANRAVAALFPNSTFVALANARHVTMFSTGCAVALANTFIDSFTPGDTSCARTPEFLWPAVGRFPLLARNARAAQATAQNQASVAERRVASVAVAAVVDAFQRSLIGSGSGVGLRGGSFQTNDYLTYTFTASAFSQDVQVTGSALWDYDYSVQSDITVSGAGTAGGTLHISGSWGLGIPGNFTVTGTLGGKPVAVLVPEI